MNIDPTTNLSICTPAFGCRAHTSFVHSLLKTTNMLVTGGIKCTVSFLPGDSLVTRARNVMVAQFMAGPCTHLLFIDSDIKWDPQAVLRLIAGTQFPDVEVCSGIYPKKCLPSEFPVNFVPGSEHALNQHAGTGFVEIKDAPTGFLMITRAALVKMMLAYPERQCVMRHECPANEAPFEYALFDCLIDGTPNDNEKAGYSSAEAGMEVLRGRKSDRRYLSEDFGFSRLWQRIGGKIWMDPQIKLSHYGEYEYRAEIASRLVAADDSTRPMNALEIEGWMTAAELEFLAGAAKCVDSVAEVGSWKGRSTFALLANCPGPVYAVDHWLGSEGETGVLGPHAEAQTGDVFSQFLHNVGHFPNLKVVKKPSVDAAADVPEVDLVFLDGGHREADVVADLDAWTPKARKIILGHDYNWPGVKKAVDERFGDRVQQVAGSIWAVNVETA